MIGTGIYTDDVNQEIARIEQKPYQYVVNNFRRYCFIAHICVTTKLANRRERQEVVDNLNESTERYHTLIEATTEGTLLVLDERCRYANPTFLSMLVTTLVSWNSWNWRIYCRINGQ